MKGEGDRLVDGHCRTEASRRSARTKPPWHST